MAFVLNSVITIGNYHFKGVNELVIKKNIHVIVDTAKLKIPALASIPTKTTYTDEVQNNISEAIAVTTALTGFKLDNKQPKSSVETADLFNEGDKVSIDLGYNGDLRNEFRGFVRRVNQTVPLEVEIEGYAWQLRNQNILANWKKTTLKDILSRLIQGTDIVLSPEIPSVSFDSFNIPNWNGLKVLEYLKEKQLLTIYFDDNVLYAGLEEGRNMVDTRPNKSLTGLAEVIYNIGYNCPTNQPNLKRRLGKDNLIRVRLKTRGKDGKHTLYEAGDVGGAVMDKIIPYTRDQEYLNFTAAAYLKKLKYDGYEGTLTSFLQPFCKPGWKAILKDNKYAGARSGTYFIAGTEVQFGIKGGKRMVSITYRLDVPTI
ncbi:hypothetical protein [Mucilaginibacter sp.]|uniref:hypothetical protein n=1 Tax=Mucilaginibacter sp. TaxID=1882438 RepID=UPI0026008C03|nr:hypothetical protein [Mucilaginibacter sp.]